MFKAKIKNKYLEDFGLKKTEYGNCDIYNLKSFLRFSKQQRQYGFDEREIYAIYDAFIEWLYSHLRMYQQLATKNIDLDACKLYDVFVVTKDKKVRNMTQMEALNLILDACEDYLELKKDDENSVSFDLSESLLSKKMQHALRIFVKSLPAWWW